MTVVHGDDASHSWRKLSLTMSISSGGKTGPSLMERAIFASMPTMNDGFVRCWGVY